MDNFLTTVGSEFDPAFIKLHVGTDDLDELIELTWDKSDLQPLVDAGLKPILRNKLFRAILEERAARSSTVAPNDDSKLPMQVDSEPSNLSTGTPSSESLLEIENKEVSLSEIHDDGSSWSEVSQETSTHAAQDECTKVDPTVESNTEPSSCQEAVPDQEDSGNIHLADFPLLGVAGKRPEVPQAKQTRVLQAKDIEKASAYPLDAREQRRVKRAQQALPQSYPAQVAQPRPPPRPAQTRDSRTMGYGRQFGAYQPMSSAYQSSYTPGQPLAGCPRSCRICYPRG